MSKEKKKLIELNGQIFNPKDIVTVSRVKRGTSMSLITLICGYAWYEFNVELKKGSIYYNESFRINWFTNKPKNKQIEEESRNKVISEYNRIIKIWNKHL